MWSRTFIFYVFIQICSSGIIYKEEEKKTTYPIFGLFDHGSGTQMRAFEDTMRNAQFEPMTKSPSIEDNGHSAWRELCSNRTMKPVIVFGPQNPLFDGAVRQQCTLANIPHIQATWQPTDPDLELNEEEIPEDSEDSSTMTFKDISINFYPDADEIAFAYAEILNYYNWQNFAVLYEDDFGLLRVQKIIAEHSKNYPILIRRLNPGADLANREIFKELSLSQESRILLDCHEDRIMKYMEDAGSLKMLNPYQHYIIVSMEASGKSELLSNFHSNFTWFTITSYESLSDPQHYLAGSVGKWTKQKLKDGPPVTNFTTEALIMDDVARHISKSLEGLKGVTQGINPCDSRRRWRHGAKLQNEILKTVSTGVTGEISFDEKGRRKNYILHMNEIYGQVRRTLGTWNSTSRNLTIIKSASEASYNFTANKEFIVSNIANGKTLLLEKEPCTQEPCEKDEHPEEEYDGFSVELIREIVNVLREQNFNYTFRFLPEDKSYGHMNPETKKWDGLIGDLLDKRADLAVCDITITEERKKLLDFSVPFMTLGISILYTKEEKETPALLSFLNPYSLEMWIYTATAYCCISIVLFICSRISPADWENPQPCDKDPEELENIWNFKNCTWLTMGSIMTQGCDILPKAFGSRWVCAIWWFFAMIVCQTYIAQLAAAMTTATLITPISDVESLAKQGKVKYGAYDKGSTLDFFKKSKDKMFQKMYENMIKNPAVLTKGNEEGERRVLSGKSKYAYFMESSTIEYKVKRNCNLKKVGGELDSKDYGIAMPANSPYRSTINTAILKLRENNKLNLIKEKWWDKMDGAKSCEDSKDANDVEGDLELENLRGLFIVLIVGLVISLFITAAEFMNEVRNIVVREQVSHKEVFIKELKSSLNFTQLQKEVIRNPSRAPSVASSIKSSKSNKSSKSDKSRKRALFLDNFLENEQTPQ